nr:NAD(P)/FAD-dependent oxidoreductase [uncultured Undibacterium sp.]
MTHIVIAGAGIAGLASAILLTRQGHQVDVFEQVADPTPVGAGLLLQPSGQAMLQNLGLLDAVKAKAAVVHSLEGYTGSWKTLDLHYQFAHEDWYGLGIHRASLHHILWRCAQNLGVAIHLGNGISAFSQDAQRVQIQHQQGSSQADGLIIANGARSLLRDQLDIAQIHRPYPWGAYWAVLDRDDWPFPHILMQRYRGAHIMLGILPSGINPETNRKFYSLFWSLPKAAFSEYRQAGMSGLIERIRHVWPEVAEWLANAPETAIAIAEYADVRLTTYHQERVVVLGDAAHAMSPQLGQGANMALIDATILAKCLASPGENCVGKLNSNSVTAAFADYSQRRRKHIAYYQMVSRIMTPLYQSNYAIGWLRDLGTVAGRRVPAVYHQYLLTLCGAKQGMLDMRAAITDL